MTRIPTASIVRLACASWLLFAATAQGQTDGTWTALTGIGNVQLPSGPARLTHDGIYDPVRKRMILFGGSVGNQVSDATWVTFGNGSWLEIHPGSLPPPRRLHSATYDPIWDRMIVIGGYDNSPRSDVWALSLPSAPSWIELTPTGPPFPARAGHVAVYDPVGQRIVVFGGYDGVSPTAGRRNDVWALSLAGTPTWSDITPTVPGPSPRSGMSAIYDASRQRMVIFGGSDPSFLNDTWALSLSGTPTWSAVTPAGPLPPAREEHTATYDPTHDQMIVTGGTNGPTLGDIWYLSFAGTPTWSQVTSCEPRLRWGHVAILDPERNEIRVQGGFDGVNTTGSTWAIYLGAIPGCAPVAPVSQLGPARHTPGFAHDPAHNAMWLFGGSDVSSYSNQVYRLSLGSFTTWGFITTAGTPPSARRQAETIYDPLRDRLIVFGGFDGTFHNDTWALSSLSTTPTWSLLTPLTLPPPRSGHRMVYDAAGDRVVMYGGYDGVSPRRDDVWELRLGSSPLTWSNVTPAVPGPGARSSHSAVYDPNGARMLVFGGTGPAFRNDVWQLSLPSSGPPIWSQILATGPPPAREEHSMILDPVRNRLVVFGGSAQNLFNDLWSLPLSGPPTWQPMSPSGVFVGARWGHGAGYDPGRDRMVIHGGFQGGGTALNATLFLTWSQPTATQAALVAAVGEPGAAHLEWELRGDASPVRLERQDRAGWVERATLSPDGRGRVRFVDREVTAGGHYEYRLVDPGSGNVLSQTTVDIPVERLALQSASYRDGRLVIDCTLPREVGLSVELLDASGRRAYQLTWYARQIGTQRIEIRTPHLASGMYFARIRQDGESRTKSVAIVR